MTPTHIFVAPKVEQKFISIFVQSFFDKKMPSGWSPVGGFWSRFFVHGKEWPNMQALGELLEKKQP